MTLRYVRTALLRMNRHIGAFIFLTIITHTSAWGMISQLTPQETRRVIKRTIAERNLGSEKKSFLYNEITALADRIEQDRDTRERICKRFGYNEPAAHFSHGRHYLEFATTHCLKKYLLDEFHCAKPYSSQERQMPRKKFLPHLAAISRTLASYKATIPRSHTVFVDFDPCIYSATCSCKPQCKEIEQLRKCPTAKHDLMRVYRCYYTDALPLDRLEELREIDGYEQGFGIFD
jgi:hypothetical protein